MKISKLLLGGLVSVACIAGLGSGVLAQESATTPEVPKFEQFDPANYKGETGKIAMPCECSVQLSLQKGDKPRTMVSLSGKGSEIVAPVGTYTLGFYVIEIQSKGGTTWMIEGSGLDSGKPIKLVVESGKSAKLDVGAKFVSAIKSGKTGTVASAYPSAGQTSLMILSSKSEDSELMVVNGNGKNAVVPAGDFFVAGWSTTLPDQAGKKWMISSTASGVADLKPLQVKADAEVALAKPEPLTASVDVQQDGDKVSMSLKMLSAKGENCSIMLEDEKAEPPSFQVLDKSGKVVMSGKFQYGWGGSCSYSGGIPSEVKGTVTVRPVMKTGPFNVKMKDTVWARK